MEWFHPHWFMKWLVEAGIPAYLAAGLSFYAVKTALRIANDNRSADERKSAAAKAERRELAVLSLEMAVREIDNFKKVVELHNADGFPRIIFASTADVLEHFVDYALAQHVPEREIIQAAAIGRATVEHVRGFHNADVRMLTDNARAKRLAQSIDARVGEAPTFAELVAALRAGR